MYAKESALLENAPFETFKNGPLKVFLANPQMARQQIYEFIEKKPPQIR